MRMHFNHWLFRFWPLKHYAAITLPWGVYFRDSLMDVDLRIFTHEQVHLEQIQKVGVIRFYFQYVIEYIGNLFKYRNHDQAYRNISFEKEAYESEFREDVEQ